MSSPPTPSTPFIGRERERQAVEAALESARLVTLTGPGGVGKTRLAARIASGHNDVVFCRLEAARQAVDVAAVVARALELPLDRREVADPGRAIDAELAARGKVLIILDNVEQVRPAMEALVPRWLAAAPQARFLLTSRWPVRLSGEVAVPIEPLGADAATLFRAAAPVALPEDRETQEEIAALVRELDGLPLAIELAAARLEVVSLRTLRARLKERFGLLRDPERADERHGTLWNTVAWSWGLLTPWEQAALEQLAVFEGGFTLTSAEAVVALADGRPALDAIHALHRKALVAIREADRYALPETIRAFAAAKLAEGILQAAVEARHTRWFLSFGPESAEAVGSPAGASATAALAAELPELLAVMRRALETTPPTAESAEQALRAARCLQPLLNCRIPAVDAEALLTATLQHAGTRAPSPLVADVRRLRARAMRYQSRMDEAIAELEVAAVEAEGDAWVLARIANTRAELLCLCHRLVEARQCSEKALALHRELRNPHGEGISEAQLGLLSSFQGDLREARARWLAARTLLDGTGDQFYQAVVRGHLASLALETGDLGAARDQAAEALALHTALGNRRSAAICRGYYALVDHHTGALDAARALYGVVIADLDRVGEARFAACYRFYVALVDMELGRDPGETLPQAERALAQLGELRYLALARSAAAALAIRQGADAQTCLGAVAAELKAVADPLLTPVYGLPLAAALLARSAPMEEVAFQAEMMDRVAGDDARLAARIVRAWVATHEADARAWLFAADGTWFEPHASERVDLGHRVPLTRLLAALLAANGAEVERDALIAAGWPGERLVPEAAGNRLRVGLSTLRSLGLGALIERTEHGYRLTHTVPVRVVAA